MNTRNMSAINIQFKHVVFIAISILMAFAATSCKPSGSNNNLAPWMKDEDEDPEPEVTVKEGTYRFATFNLRYNSANDKNEKNWTVRKEFVKKIVLDGDYDIAGLVEVSQPLYRSDLSALLGDTYALYICGREDGGILGEGVGLIYKKSRFTVQNCGHYWLNEHPDQKGEPQNWAEPVESVGNRLVTWAKMKDKTNGKEFFYFVAHFYLNAGARKHSSQLVIDKCKELNPGGLPEFFCGDLNAQYQEESMSILRTYFMDSYLYAQENKIVTGGAVTTYNSWNSNISKFDTAKRIDYIYFHGDVTLNKYCVDYSTYNNSDYRDVLPSDHYPVYVDVTF